VTAHPFAAVAFEENLSLRELLPAFPGAKLSARQLRVPSGAGEIFIYPFGAVVFRDVPPEQREAELDRLRRARPGLTTQVIRETFTVREEPGAKPDIVDGSLVVDSFSAERAELVALIVAQSAAMEYYERIVTQLFARTAAVTERLEKRGSVAMRMRGLNKFVGEAINTRSEVILVLTLLDKPDAIWDDPAMDHIYGDLRAEFDLVDRYDALEYKLRGIQEALSLVLDAAREQRMWLLELSIGLLIVFELLLEIWRAR